MKKIIFHIFYWAWCFCLSMSLWRHSVGRTLGKWLLNIQVKSNEKEKLKNDAEVIEGKKLTFPQALHRSFNSV